MKIHHQSSLKTSKIPVFPEKASSGFMFFRIFEVLNLIDGEFSKEIKKYSSTKTNTIEIEEILSTNNFKNIKLDGLIKTIQGETILSELMRKTGFLN